MKQKYAHIIKARIILNSTLSKIEENLYMIPSF